MTLNCGHIITCISFLKTKLSTKVDAIHRNHKIQRKAKLLNNGKMYFTILRYNGNITWIQRLHGSLRFLNKRLRTMTPYLIMVLLNLLMHNIVYFFKEMYFTITVRTWNHKVLLILNSYT